MKKILQGIAMILFIAFVASCTETPVEVRNYTVTFDTDGGNAISPQTVENGNKVVKPEDPVKEGFMFTGVWLFGTFEWSFDLDIVTSDITLKATYIEISSTPTNIQMTEDAFSSMVTWFQTDANLQTFKMLVRQDSNPFVEIEGSFNINTDQVLHQVTFTPNVIPLGGLYDVKIEAGLESAEALGLLFGGAGTLNNPFLVSEVSDVVAILDNVTFLDKHFKQINDIVSTISNQILIDNTRKQTFNGVYDGGNFMISFTGNGGLFHIIGQSGVVKNLVISSTTNLSAAEANEYPIGAVADRNEGLIDNVSSRAVLENARLQGNLPVFVSVDKDNLTTGAGGIVGLNAATGIIRNTTVGGAGAIKAGRAIGGIAAYNFGLIEYVIVTATLPAGNQANSGNSSNTYAYGGGIAGFNFGTIQFASVTGRVFAQSAYAEAGNGNEGKNIGFGGIAGYNEGIIRNSSFARSLAAKEFIDKERASELGDAANNLGVASIFGDMYVGGIAGINAGSITDSYVGGAIIGARDFAGGVTGLSLDGGTITNTYVFAEVAIKDQSGKKVLEANAKTTLTTYDIAPSGFDINTTLFKPLVNSNTNQTWIPGEIDAPKLPVFESSDLTKVGNQFAPSGVLLWQQGSVTSVNIGLDTVALPFGSTIQLEFSVTPASAPDLYTTWTSSDPEVVRIIGEGLIEGIGEGSAVITVTTRDGSFTDTVNVTVEDYVKVTSVSVTSLEFTLPAPNTSADRPEIEIDTVIFFNVELLPLNAQFRNFTLSSSNSRAVVDGNKVTFVFGATSLGNVSITVSFEDSSVAPLEYRFKTIQVSEPVDTPISSVSITSPDITLPAFNNADVRDDIVIGTSINLVIDILPLDASNKNYTITSSNSRGSVNGNTFTFNTLGLISILVRFEDTSIGNNGEFNFRFTIVEGTPPEVAISSVAISSPDMTLPAFNNADVRDDIVIGTSINLVVDILPLNASNKNYTISSSNSRGSVNGNVFTFSALGLISIYVDFEDTTIGDGGRFNFRFTVIEGTAPEVAISSVVITSPEMTLPEANNQAVRPEIVIGTTITINVDILPLNATNQNFTITSSNSRAVVDGSQVQFVLGTGVGNVSIRVNFEDTSVGVGGVFEFRFLTIQPTLISSVTISTPEVTLPEPNNSAVRPEVTIGTVMNIVVDILPLNATNKNFTVTSSNSRAVVTDNKVEFVLGTGTGSVSIRVIFEDTSIGIEGVFEYRFTTVQPTLISSVMISTPEVTLPEPNNSAVRPQVTIGTVMNIVVDILPLNATNKNFTVTSSNSRAVVTDNKVEFVLGSGTGSVSIRVIFEDTSIGVDGVFEFRFTTVQPVALKDVIVRFEGFESTLIKEETFKEGDTLTFPTPTVIAGHRFLSWDTQAITLTQNITVKATYEQIQMTLAELSAFDGRNGNQAYIAIESKIYDVTGNPYWPNGLHRGVYQAGQDLTAQLSSSPHGIANVLKQPLVGFVKS